MTRQQGFTLVEVLVALLILAIALGAGIVTMSQQARNAEHLKHKTLGLWIAHNRLTEYQLLSEWPDTGETSGENEMSGVEWRWTTKVSETEDENLRRIDIRVLDPDDPDRTIAEIDGFIAQQ